MPTDNSKYAALVAPQGRIVFSSGFGKTLNDAKTREAMRHSGECLKYDATYQLTLNHSKSSLRHLIAAIRRIRHKAEYMYRTLPLTIPNKTMQIGDKITIKRNTYTVTGKF